MSIALKSAIAVTALLAADWAASSTHPVAEETHQDDPRLPKLRQFFIGMNSPGYAHAEDFLSASDRFGLDWRLLPSLSILESGGGRESQNNNILGWDSCRRKFPSVTVGINHVAYRLAESNCFKNKSLDDVLRIYNPKPDYPQRAKSLMARLDPDRYLLPPTR